MPGGFAEVGVLADFASLIEQSDAAGLSIEAFAGKVVTSSRTASRAMVDFMKTNGASADEMKSAAAETAAAWDATYGQLSKGAKAQADASLTASRAAKESAAQQSAAYAETAAAARDAELQQKAASDAAVVASAKTAAAAEASAARVTAAGKKLASIGKWSLFGGAAAVALSVDGAAKLQTAMEQLHTQAGVTQQAVKGLTTSVLNMSGSLATSPDALAASLYHVESGGIHGANALKVMSAAAKEAKVSGADLTDTTTALTATVFSGISGAQNYTKAMGLLNATVGAGDMTFQDLNEALGGPMLATVKGYGLSLKDVGAAMATFGDLNIRGADAATQLRMAVQYMAKPAATAGPILQQLGLSTTSFADAMSKGGLLPALQLLHDKLVEAQIPAKDYAQVMGDIFSKKGASGITILENSLDKLKTKYTDIQKGTGQANAAWDAWNKTLQADLDHLRATVEALADKFGMALIPALKTVATDIGDVVVWLEKNKMAAEALGIAIGVTLGSAVTVFAVQKVGAFVGGVKGMATGVSDLTGKLLQWPAASEPAQTETQALTTAIQELTTALAPVPEDADAAASGIGLVGDRAETATGQLTIFDGELDATTAQLDAVTTAAEGAAGAIASVGAAGAGAETELGGGAAIGAGTVAGGAATGLASAFAGFLLASKLSKSQNPFAAAEKGGQYDPYGPNTSPVPKPGQAQYQSGDAKTASSASIAALAELRKQIAAIKDPADLSSKKLNELYKEAEHLAGMKGVTARQHTAISSLESALSPSAAIPGVSGSATTANPAQLVNFLQKALGLTKNQAAGIAGNVQVESAGTFAGNIVQGGARASTIAAGDAMGTGGGYGMAQWTDPGRQQNLAALAKQMGLPQDSVKVQEAFIVQELKGSYSTALQNLKGTTTAAQAATVIQNEYEGPASLTASLAERQQDAIALAGGKTVPVTGGGSTTSSGGSTVLQTIQNLASGGKSAAGLPIATQNAVLAAINATPIAQRSTTLQATGATNQATQLSDQSNQAQAVGQAQVTLLQAVNQQLQDKGSAIVQKLADTQTKTNDQSARLVTGLKDSSQTAGDHAAALVTAMKNQQTVADQASAILVAKIQTQTTAINDASAITVAAINASATKIADASNAQATLITDNAQTTADTLAERGLYGLNLVAQQDQVIADQIKAGFDAQIATAQTNLDIDQGAANIANAQAQQATDQVTATQNMNVLLAQQKVNTVTQTQDAKEAKAQAHLDAVTAKQDMLESIAKVHLDSVTMTQDAKANAAKAHLDATTISQDNRILKATQHADAVQLSVDTTKIGPAQTIADWAATQSKTIQTEAQNTLSLATAQGSETVNAAQLQLQNVTASANTAIATAQNASQSVQNATNKAIQVATDQSQSATNAANQAIQTATSQNQTVQNTANTLIQQATDLYQTAQDNANQAIANATQTQASTASTWAQQLAKDQALLSGTQGQAATGEAGAQGTVTTTQAAAATQFAGSGLNVNIYGADLSNASMITDAASWAIRTAGVATA